MKTHTESLWSGLLIVTVASLSAACTDSSGQTGSPNNDPPPYEIPLPIDPNRGDGLDGGFGAAAGVAAEAVPSRGPVILSPQPKANAALVVDSLLLRAGPQGLTVLDVSNPAAPVLAGHVALGPTALIAAPTRDRVALTVTQKSRYSGTEIPTAPLPDREQYLKLLDVTDPQNPLERASALLPAGTLAVVPLPTGYAALGARFSGALCYGLDGVAATEPDLPRPLFIERFVQRDGSLVSEARQEYEVGAFELSSDGEHAVRFPTDARGAYASEVAVEVIDLTTFESKTPLSIPKPPAGASISADVAGSVLLLAAGSQLQAVDLSSGDVSAPLSADGNIYNMRFVVPGALAALGAGNDLVRLMGAGAGLALSLVPLPDAGTPLMTFAGALIPFGNSFLQLGASGSSPEDARVLAKRYAFGDAGLAFLDEAQTDWPYTCCERFSVDARSEQVAYSVGAGPIGVLANAGGTFGASTLSAIGARVEDGSFLFDDETLFVNHTSSVEPVAIDLSGTRPALQVAPSLSTASADVLDRLAQGGLLFTLESQDGGEPSFGYRKLESSARVVLGVPHGAEAMFALDDAHVAVLGLSYSGECERLTELGANGLECGVDRHNGVSVFAIHGDSVELVRSLPLSQQALLAPSLEAVEQTLDWSGFVEIAGGRFELLGTWKRHCTSEASCRAISTVAYSSTTGMGASSMCGANCAPTEAKTVDGYRSESVLLALDFSNPDEPGLGTLALGGKAQDISRPYRYDVGPHLLRYQADDGEHLAYASLEPVYGSSGSQLSDSHGQPLERHYVTLLESSSGELAFGADVNVPGAPIALSGSELTRKQAGQALFTLEPRYHPNGSPYQALDRVRIEAGLAFVEERLDVGPFVSAQALSSGLVALLASPADVCSENANYELRVADARGQTLELSDPVVLPLSGERWEHARNGYSLGSEPSALAPEGQVYVYGGPASNGRLALDITYNPPRVLRYETLE